MNERLVKKIYRSDDYSYNVTKEYLDVSQSIKDWNEV